MDIFFFFTFFPSFYIMLITTARGAIKIANVRTLTPIPRRLALNATQWRNLGLSDFRSSSCIVSSLPSIIESLITAPELISIDRTLNTKREARGWVSRYPLRPIFPFFFSFSFFSLCLIAYVFVETSARDATHARTRMHTHARTNTDTATAVDRCPSRRFISDFRIFPLSLLLLLASFLFPFNFVFLRSLVLISNNRARVRWRWFCRMKLDN